MHDTPPAIGVQLLTPPRDSPADPLSDLHIQSRRANLHGIAPANGVQLMTYSRDRQRANKDERNSVLHLGVGMQRKQRSMDPGPDSHWGKTRSSRTTSCCSSSPVAALMLFKGLGFGPTRGGGQWKANGRPMDGEWEASRICDFCLATRRKKSARRRRIAHTPWPVARVRTCTSMTFGIAKVSQKKKENETLQAMSENETDPDVQIIKLLSDKLSEVLLRSTKIAERRTSRHYGLVVGHADLFSMHINLQGYLQSKPKACPTSP